MADLSLLSARGLKRHFGGIKAVDGVDFDMAKGEIHALIGPNGAGKTTFVSLLSGRITPDEGQVLLEGEDITALPAHARVRKGIGYTFQITSIYPRLSLLENVTLASQRHNRAPEADARRALERVGLAAMADQTAGTLAYGHQRLLEIAIGLALEPRVLILDEPTQGLADSEIETFKSLIAALVPQTSVLLIEHNMEVVMDLAHRITVLNFGRNLATGTPAEIRANPAVQSAYLGG